MTTCDLQAVIALPSGVFKPYSGVGTAIFIFQKGHPTESVWFYKLTADGFSLDDKRTPIEANDIPDILAKWPGREEGANSFRVPVERIPENGWQLMPGRYKPGRLDAVEHDPPADILAGRDPDGDGDRRAGDSADGRIAGEMSDWPKQRFGDILSLEYGKALPEANRDGSGTCVVAGSNGPQGVHSQSLAKAPAIVIGRKGSAGQVNWFEQDVWAIDTTYFVVPKAAVNYRWLYYCLRSVGLSELATATGVPGLNRNDVYQLDVVVPPLPEQERFVRILDVGRDQSIDLLVGCDFARRHHQFARCYRRYM